MPRDVFPRIFCSVSCYKYDIEKTMPLKKVYQNILILLRVSTKISDLKSQSFVQLENFNAK